MKERGEKKFQRTKKSLKFPTRFEFEFTLRLNYPHFTHFRRHFFPSTIDIRRGGEIILHNFRKNKRKPPKKYSLLRLRTDEVLFQLFIGRGWSQTNPSMGRKSCWKYKSSKGEWRREETTTAKRAKLVWITWRAYKIIVKRHYIPSYHCLGSASRRREKLHNSTNTCFIFTCLYLYWATERDCS